MNTVHSSAKSGLLTPDEESDGFRTPLEGLEDEKEKELGGDPGLDETAEKEKVASGVETEKDKVEPQETQKVEEAHVEKEVTPAPTTIEIAPAPAPAPVLPPPIPRRAAARHVDPAAAAAAPRPSAETETESDRTEARTSIESHPEVHHEVVFSMDSDHEHEHEHDDTKPTSDLEDATKFSDIEASEPQQETVTPMPSSPATPIINLPEEHGNAEIQPPNPPSLPPRMEREGSTTSVPSTYSQEVVSSPSPALPPRRLTNTNSGVEKEREEEVSWEERTWKELVKLKEEMFWARNGALKEEN